MKYLNYQKLLEVQGAAQSTVAIKVPSRSISKSDNELLPLPKPGPVIG